MQLTLNKDPNQSTEVAPDLGPVKALARELLTRSMAFPNFEEERQRYHFAKDLEEWAPSRQDKFYRERREVFEKDMDQLRIYELRHTWDLPSFWPTLEEIESCSKPESLDIKIRSLWRIYRFLLSKNRQDQEALKVSEEEFALGFQMETPFEVADKIRIKLGDAIPAISFTLTTTRGINPLAKVQSCVIETGFIQGFEEIQKAALQARLAILVAEVLSV